MTECNSSLLGTAMLANGKCCMQPVAAAASLPGYANADMMLSPSPGTHIPHTLHLYPSLHQDKKREVEMYQESSVPVVIEPFSIDK